MRNLILGILIAVSILAVNFKSSILDHSSNHLVSCQETCTDQDVKNIRLLAEVIYFEARSEPEAGQAAVAWVVMNRTEKEGFPGTIEKVVKQETKDNCQFSYRCDGLKDVVHEKAAWVKAITIATLVYNKRVDDPTNGSEYYLNPDKTKTRWNNLHQQIKIGSHIFYKA